MTWLLYELRTPEGVIGSERHALTREGAEVSLRSRVDFAWSGHAESIEVEVTAEYEQGVVGSYCATVRRGGLQTTRMEASGSEVRILGEDGRARTRSREANEIPSYLAARLPPLLLEDGVSQISPAAIVDETTGDVAFVGVLSRANGSDNEICFEQRDGEAVVVRTWISRGKISRSEYGGGVVAVLVG